MCVLRVADGLSAQSLNDAPMKHNDLVPLRDGDVITISKRMFRFQRGVGENASPVVQAAVASPFKAGARSEAKPARAAATPDRAHKSATPQTMPNARAQPLDLGRPSPRKGDVALSPRRSSRVSTPVKAAPLAATTPMTNNGPAALGTPRLNLGVTFSPAMSPRRMTPAAAAAFLAPRPVAVVEPARATGDAMELSDDDDDELVGDELGAAPEAEQPKSALAKGFNAIRSMVAQAWPFVDTSAPEAPRTDGGGDADDISDGVPEVARGSPAKKTPVAQETTPRSAKVRPCAIFFRAVCSCIIVCV